MPHATPPPDAPDALLARWKRTRDVTALGALFDVTAPTLFRIALATSRDAASAEDALQDTYLAALRALERHDPARPVVPFLVGILQHEVRRARRRAGRVPDPVRILAASASAEAGLEAEASEAARVAMESLEEPYRSAALLRWRYGLEPAEVAHVRGEPPGTTRSILSRALERLRGTWKGLPALWCPPRAAQGTLAGVRRAFMEEAATLAKAAGVLGGVVGGGLVMKKGVALMALLLALLAGGWTLWYADRGSGEPTSPDVHSPAESRLEARGPRREPPPALVADPTKAEPIDDVEAARRAAVLARRATLLGRVLDSQGRPVPGALVRAHGRVDSVVFARETRAGEDGAYRLEVAAVLPEIRGRDVGGTQWLSVTSPAFASLDLEAPKLRERESATRDLVLTRGAIVEGVVVEADTGRPLVGVPVRFTSYVGPPRRVDAPTGAAIEGVFEPRRTSSATSDEEGRFRISGIPCAGFHAPRAVGGERGLIVGVVAAYVPGFAPAGEEVPLVSEGDLVDARIELWPGATVKGRVLDASGDPMLGVQAWAWVEGREGQAFPGWSSPGVPSAHVRTGPDGRFTIAAVRAHRHDPTSVKVLLWRSLAFEGRGAPLAVDERTEVRGTVAAGGTLDLGEVVLPATDAPCAAIRVRDSAGNPVRGARVQIVGHPDRHAPSTDAEGRTRRWWPTWQGETLAEMRALEIDAGGFGRQVVRVEPRLGATVDVEVVLGPAHRVAGQVLGQDGRPSSGRWIVVASGRYPIERVLPSDRAFEPMAYLRQAFDLDGPLYLGETNTDEDGHFEVSGLPEGPYHVGTPGAGGRMVTVAAVATDASDVALRAPAEPRAPTVPFEGLVVDAESGAPVLRPIVSLVTDGGTVVEAEAPTVGTFRFDGLPPGTYLLRVGADGYVARAIPATRVEEGGVDRVRVELTRGAALVGRVRSAPGRSLRDHTISLRARSPDGHGEATAGARLQPDGSFRVVGLDTGRYRVWIHPPSVPSPETPVLVPTEGEEVVIEGAAYETRRDLLVVPAGTLQVQVADGRLPKAAEGAGPRDGAAEAYGAASRVIVRDASGREVACVEGLRLGAWHEASYLMLPAGRYAVRYERPSATPEVHDVEVRAGCSIEVTVPDGGR